MMLTISDLSKSFPKSKTSVLENISFSVNKGEFISIIGSSGCGKSTLLSIIAGVEKQTSGEVRLDDTIPHKRSGKFGYMPQQATLLPWMTVLENVSLGLTIRNIAKKTRDKKALQLLNHFQLDSFTNMYPKTLSGGMAQRVALLRTILFNNQCILLDEPFGALDALTRISCQQWLLRVWEEYKSTVIFVTHDIEEAIFLSDRILVMSTHPGKIVKEIIVDIPREKRKKGENDKQSLKLEKELLTLLT